MKLEFLGDISKGGKYGDFVSDNLIRLYHYELTELTALQNAIKERIIVQQTPLALDKLEFITPLNCSLTLMLDDENSGINQIDHQTFVCKMNLASYEHMLNQIETLTEVDASGYNWLDEGVETSDIDFLLSPGGEW